MFRPVMAIIRFCPYQYEFEVRRTFTANNSWHKRSRSFRNMPGQAQGVPDRFRPRIFLIFGTTRVVGKPYAPAAFTPGEISGTHFWKAESTPGHMVPSEPREKSPATPPRIDPGTFRLVAQCLNHYAAPGPHSIKTLHKIRCITVSMEFLCWMCRFSCSSVRT